MKDSIEIRLYISEKNRRNNPYCKLRKKRWYTALCCIITEKTIQIGAVAQILWGSRVSDTSKSSKVARKNTMWRQSDTCKNLSFIITIIKSKLPPSFSLPGSADSWRASVPQTQVNDPEILTTLSNQQTHSLSFRRMASCGLYLLLWIADFKLGSLTLSRNILTMLLPHSKATPRALLLLSLFIGTTP